MNRFGDGRACPFFERGYEPCAKRFNLQRLTGVFEHCLGEYTACKVYHQITISRKTKDEAHAVARVR